MTVSSSAHSRHVERLVDRLAGFLQHSRRTVAVAESLTGGQLAAALASGEGAGEWFRGGIVAYHPEVKYGILEVPRGPVVTAKTAETMAASAARLLGADFAVAVTGVGGPGGEEGEPAGTVYLAAADGPNPVTAERFVFTGSPVEVMEQTIETALIALIVRFETVAAS